MELNYVVDITSAYNDVLMTYGDNYQVQRYTHGIDRISMDFWMLEDHDNGWIPNGSEMNLSGERERLYYLHDELGSITKVIGENGKTSAHYNYDEFGVAKPSVKFDQNWPGPDNTFGYTGYQYDVSSELWYAQARYYMPEIGRFISEDPWSGTITTPTTMNPYPYVLNNPLKYVDPLGLMIPRNELENAAPESLQDDTINNHKKQVQQEGTKNGSDAFYGDIEEKGNNKIFNSIDEAAADFVLSNNPLTHADNRERGTYIYKVNIDGELKYTYLESSPGAHNNVIFNAIFDYGVGVAVKIEGWNINIGTVTPVAFVHTHPSCKYHDGINFSKPDIMLTKFPGISTVYLGATNGMLYAYDKDTDSVRTVSSDMPEATVKYTDCKIK